MIKIFFLGILIYCWWMAFYVVYFDDWRIPESIIYTILGVYSIAASATFKWPQNPWWKANVLPIQTTLKVTIAKACYNVVEWFGSQLK